MRIKALIDAGKGIPEYTHKDGDLQKFLVAESGLIHFGIAALNALPYIEKLVELNIAMMAARDETVRAVIFGRIRELVEE